MEDEHDATNKVRISVPAHTFIPGREGALPSIDQLHVKQVERPIHTAVSVPGHSLYAIHDGVHVSLRAGLVHAARRIES